MAFEVTKYDVNPKDLDYLPSGPSKQEVKAFAVTTVALLAMATVAAAIAFITMALLQHYNVIHIGGKFGAVLADSGKWIMGALNAIKHGATTAAKFVAHGVQHDLATQLTLSVAGGLLVGGAIVAGGKGLRARRQEMKKPTDITVNETEILSEIPAENSTAASWDSWE